MSVFGSYSDYYDLLYQDKDYAAEAKHVNEVLQRYLPGGQSILELGCGTAAHAVHLIRNGYDIHGVDVSEAMLARAEKNKKNLDSSLSRCLSFSIGDIRNVRLGSTYDAVIALFHVISYLPKNEDIRAVLYTVRSHLRKDGIFIFDCWYGPAVLTERPEVRVKRFEDNKFRLTRIAEPTIKANENIVDVKYLLIAENKASKNVEMMQETHRMRYLFKPEIEMFFASAGIKLVGIFEWMTDHEPSFTSWNISAVGRV
jgi:SAM-dependent methyltransferase